MIFLTSANSINVARWLPQQFYYFFGWKQWKEKGRPPVICVPSGNFGNICAGLLAMQSGLPARHFVAACNANDAVTKYLQTSAFKSQEAIPTLSNAMDVGNPSNFVRILELFSHQFPDLQKVLSSSSCTDEETKTILKSVYQNNHYLLDPHGAVGYLALQQYLQSHPLQKGIVLETAHPVKFYDVVEPIINEVVPVPSSIEYQLRAEKKSTRIEAKPELLKSFLFSLG